MKEAFTAGILTLIASLTLARAEPLITFPASGTASPGCPIDVRVTYQQENSTFSRTYYGGTSYPGICAHKIKTSGGFRDSASVAGLWFDNPMVSPQTNADGILPVLMAKNGQTNNTFTAKGKANIFKDSFSFVQDENIQVNNQSYQAKVYEYIERDFSTNRMYQDFYCTWVQNPYNPEAPIYYGSRNAGISLYFQQPMTAIKIEFLGSGGPHVE